LFPFHLPGEKAKTIYSTYESVR